MTRKIEQRFAGIILLSVLAGGCYEEKPAVPEPRNPAPAELAAGESKDTAPAESGAAVKPAEPAAKPAPKPVEPAAGAGAKPSPTTRPASAPATAPTSAAAVDEMHPQVVMETNMGTIVIELDRENAPITADNFLRYVDDTYYDGTLFHRVISDFMIQGGGFEPGLKQKPTRPPIRNEASNGLHNERGTIAMARLNAPHSATSQFFINVVDNQKLDYGGRISPAGYCVFGRVVEGMDVADKIRNVPTGTAMTPEGVPMENVPIANVIIKSIRRK